MCKEFGTKSKKIRISFVWLHCCGDVSCFCLYHWGLLIYLLFCWFDSLIVSVAWVAHIVIYLLINPPLSPFLNDVFIKLDDIWGNVKVLCIFLSFSFASWVLTLRWRPYLPLHQVCWALEHLHSSASTFYLQWLRGQWCLAWD